MKTFLLVLTLIFLTSYNILADSDNLICPPVSDCSIENVTAEVTQCENELFNVLINFAHQFTSDSFRINGNGVMYGHFAYSDLPVLLEGLSANCETNYEFGITDLEYAGCHSAAELGVVCCPGDCIISNLQLTTSVCIGGNHHTLTMNFDVENPGNDYYEVWINGVFRGTYLISQLPLTLTLENTTVQFDHVVICINDVEDCCIEGDIANPCYSPGNCEIYNVVTDVTTCENGLFNVLLNFQHQFTSDSFRINGNGVMYGHFAYSDLPVLLEGLSANCETNYEFGITDLEYAGCHSADELGVVCCPGDCMISNLQLSTSDCINNNHHNLIIDFDVENPGNNFYEVWVNSIYRGTYLISELPLTLIMENTTLVFDHVLVCINDVEDCCIDDNIENPCYNSGDCHIYDVVADVTLCENGLFNVLINFQHEFTSDSFRINGNGVVYGHFAYSDLPVLLEGLSANCETNYEFGITDLEFSDCHAAKTLGIVCCEEECSITGLTLTTTECSSENDYLLTIDFDYINANNNYFDLWVDSEFIGYFSLSILPFQISVNNSGFQSDTVIVCIHEQGSCCADGIVVNPCFNSGECSINGLEANVAVCEDKLFNVIINFEHKNTSESFKVVGNGVFYGNFYYKELPILLEGLNADCITNYEFTVIDRGNESCHNSIDIDTVCCETNSFSNATLTKNNFYYSIDFKQLELDFNENLYSEVNITIFNLLGQKLDQVKLLNVSGENYIDILKPDNIQFARIDMLQNSKMIESKTLKIIKPARE